ncbi:MAG: hypothetical protein FGM57_02320 [Candidatus Taylorbacteria bacterium]|nr:hypothetical protein [Candidatus Taylorbacteria bacterium]
MNKTTRTISIISIILAISAVSGYIYVTRYIEGLTQKTVETKDELEILNVRLGHLKALHQAAQDTNDSKAKIGSYLIKSGGSVPFITEFEQLASSIGLTYTTDRIESRGVPDLETHQKELLVVSFTVNGYWSSVFKFIKLVELMPYSLVIERIELTTQDVSKKEGVVLTKDLGTTTASTTPEVQRVVSKESIWKANILFTVVKNKDN